MNTPLFSLLVILMYNVNLSELATIYYDNGGTFVNNFDGLGNYHYKVDLPDQQKEEQGTKDVSKAGEDNYIVHGTYSFTYGGKLYKVSYIADSNGYRPQTQIVNEGAVRPTATPPIVFLPPSTTTQIPINPHALVSISGIRGRK